MTRPLSPKPEDTTYSEFDSRQHEVEYHQEKVVALVQLFNATERQKQLEAELSCYKFDEAEEEELELQIQLSELVRESKTFRQRNKRLSGQASSWLEDIEFMRVRIYLKTNYPGFEFDFEALHEAGWTPEDIPEDECVWESLGQFLIEGIKINAGRLPFANL